MRDTLVPSVTVAVLALLAASGAARADEVVLDNGRTLVGRVILDDGKTLKIEMASGVMTFDRERVKEVRKGPVPERKPDPPAADPPKDDGRRGAGGAQQGGSKQGDPSGSRSSKDRTKKERASPAGWTPTGATYRPRPANVRDSLTELDATQLTPWPETDTVNADDREAGKSWKVLLADGRTEQRAEAPKGPDGIARAWVLRDPVGGTMMVWRDGARVFEWVPMWWNEDQGKWWLNPPELETFQRYDSVSDWLLRMICKDDTNCMVACSIAVQEMGRKQGGSRVRKADVSVEAEMAEIREAAAKVVGESAAAGVTRCFEIEHLMKWENAAGKIRLAKERTGILRRLAADVK